MSRPVGHVPGGQSANQQSIVFGSRQFSQPNVHILADRQPEACDINPIAYTLFNYKLPNGQYLIPSANPNALVAI